MMIGREEEEVEEEEEKKKKKKKEKEENKKKKKHHRQSGQCDNKERVNTYVAAEEDINITGVKDRIECCASASIFQSLCTRATE